MHSQREAQRKGAKEFIGTSNQVSAEKSEY
jgi:hypothetical protein